MMVVHVRAENEMRHGPTPLLMADAAVHMEPTELMVPTATPSHCTVKPPWQTAVDPENVAIATFDTHMGVPALHDTSCPRAWKLRPRDESKL